MNATKTSQQQFLDILFSGRNKDYGAYDLRLRYESRVRNAIAGMAAIALVIVGGYTVSSRLMAANNKPDKPREKETTVLTALDMPEEKPALPPPPPPPAATPPPMRPSVKFTTPEIAKDDQVNPDDEPPKMDVAARDVVSTVNAAGSPDGIDVDLIPERNKGNGVVEVPPAPKEDNTPFTFVEQMPAFPGGDAALFKYLNDHIRYPRIAMENGIDGTVNIAFVVDREGNIIDVHLNGAKKGGGLDEEAMRVVKAMPKWKPGKQNGRTVAVVYSLPVRFRLEQ